jgi:hypothetical protein
MKKVTLVVFAIASLLASSAFAGDFATRGCIELGGTVGFTSQTGLTTFDIGPYVGYFIMDQLEIGLRPNIAVISPSGGSSSTNINVVAAPAWNFKLSNPSLTPFVEAQIGFNSTSSGGGASTSGFVWGGLGGVKILMGSNGLLNFGLGYTSTTVNSVSTNVFGIQGGFTIFLSK